MQKPMPATQIVRFGLFEVDLRSGELSKRGLKVKLQEKPFQMLAALLERPGEAVSKEELREKLWGPDTFVEFNSSLKMAANKLRTALGDSAGKPRFIETLARRGYRVIAPVEKDVAVGAAAASREDRVKLAVLPFYNMGGESGQEFFSEGLTDEITAQLGSLSPQRLGVVARASAMKYKHTDKGIDQIGQELGVDYILEGNVLHSDRRVRITGGLVQVSDQTYLWTKSYEREISDAMALQRDVAESMAKEIQVVLLPQGVDSPYSLAAA
jgi:TolB-like protein